ncbi:hypothetical protein SARC_16593, partial [Sphaeroforma arctica JP610]
MNKCGNRFTDGHDTYARSSFSVLGVLTPTASMADAASVSGAGLGVNILNSPAEGQLPGSEH